MKECTRFEKLLPGYLHGELYEKEYHALRTHLEQCAACRAELQAQHATLQWAGRVMQAVPTPARMSAWRRRPIKTVDLRQGLFARIWFSPQFKAALATGVVASVFMFLAGTFVVFSTVSLKGEVAFTPPTPVERPKMKLRKLQVAGADNIKSDGAKLRRNILVKPPAADIDVPMPPIEGMIGGAGAESAYFYGDLADAPVQLGSGDRPTMVLKKPKVKVAKGSQPKPSSRIVAKVRTAKTPDIQIPDLVGTGTGLLGGTGLGGEALAMMDAEADHRSVVLDGAYLGETAGDEFSAVRDTVASLEPADLFGMAAPVDADTDGVAMAGLGFSMSESKGVKSFGTEESETLQVAGMNGSGRMDQSFFSMDLGMTDGNDRALETQTSHYEVQSEAEPQPESVDFSRPWSSQEEWFAGSADNAAVLMRMPQNEPMEAADGLSSGMDDLFGESTALAMTSGRKADAKELADKDGAREQTLDFEDDLFGGVESQSVVGYTINKIQPMEIEPALGDNEALGRGYADDSISVSDYGWKEEQSQPEPVVEIEATFTELGADSTDEQLVALEFAPVSAENRSREEINAEVEFEQSKRWSGRVVDAAPPKRERKPAEFNPYVMAEGNPFSTFSIDVDTASYGLARQQLLNGSLPDTEAVRTEEFVNSFDYDYRPPSGSQTFAVHTEMAPSPFRSRMELLKIGVKGRRIGRDDHRRANLTLVIDTSGSMSTPDRLGLIQQSLALLIDQLNPEDQIAIVQFGGEARLICEHTPVSNKEALLQVINTLQAGGPTQFDKGLELGYQLATSGYVAGDSNRIIILSDGVANLGELDPDAILEQVAGFRKKGIYLSVLGFGAGTYDDEMLEQLANRGDGTYAYVNTLDEARYLFVERLAATLHVIASDVKIQVEFNPARVLRYRQVGYENRQLTKEQFRDDTVDAGEVGSGQSVTALYEVELKPDGPVRDPISTVYVRYRRADNGVVEEINSRVTEANRKPRFEDAGLRFQLAACVAEFSEHLRRSPYTGGTDLADIMNRLQPVVLALDLDQKIQELMQLISVTTGLEN